MMSLLLGMAVWADEGDVKPEGQRAGYLQQGIMQQLTPEQREQLKAKITKLKADGASREEIRKGVTDMLKEWGIKPQPQRFDKAIWQQLTPDQREELRSTIAKMLKGWGIKAPPQYGLLGAGSVWGQQEMGMMQQGHRGMGMMQQWGQQAAPPWREQQAGPPPWGQQAPPPWWGQQAGPPQQWGQQAGPPQWGQQVAPPWWGQQAGPPQWGQQVAPPWSGQPGLGQHGGLMQQLTPEQREQVNTKMQEMREAGATPQEIREAIREMLEGWGIQLPLQNRD